MSEACKACLRPGACSRIIELESPCRWKENGVRYSFETLFIVNFWSFLFKFLCYTVSIASSTLKHPRCQETLGLIGTARHTFHNFALRSA